MCEQETDWQFTREDLQRTPSVGCGWTVEREELDRAKACALIYSASRKLQLPQITSSTACIYLHRFFMRHTLKEFHHYNIAATCLFFACKAEETLRKLDVFIPIIVYYASKGNRKATPGTSEFDKWRAVILGTEVVLLEALCFDMVVDHPHVALAQLLERQQVDRRVAQMAWGFIADCMRLPICIVYGSRIIAGAAVELATRVAPQDARTGLDPSWADRAGLQHSEVDQVVQWLLDFYSREAQARRAQPAEAAQTPASSPPANSSPMPHQSSPK
ncbi:hypothetical protein LPJ78_001130 [Coemansia sp. RSA 989]|nr:hypothetical protein LPJ78_001130 [Coemansia sp. RSA 989]